MVDVLQLAQCVGMDCPGRLKLGWTLSQTSHILSLTLTMVSVLQLAQYFGMVSFGSLNDG
jgi:hypothetical protein